MSRIGRCRGGLRGWKVFVLIQKGCRLRWVGGRGVVRDADIMRKRDVLRMLLAL